MSTAPLEPGRFDSTVPYYVAYRPRYPLELLRRTLTELGLRAGARVLDLGCGPGFLANGFAALGCSCVGIDPSRAMLDAAVAEAGRASVAVNYRHGSSFDLDQCRERFDCVAMGRSFHWMDRESTIQLLDTMVEPGGSVVLFYDFHMRCTENAFDGVIKDVRKKHGGDRERWPYRQDKIALPDESVLLGSPFCQLLRIGMPERRSLTIEDIVGRAYSLSGTSPERLGQRAAAFERELREELSALKPDGQFTELIEFAALIARRP